MPLEIPSSYNISFLPDPAKPIESYFPSRFSPETARPALSGGVSRVERDMVPRQGGRKQPASAVGAAGPNHVNTGRLSKRKEVVELGPTSSTAVWSQVEGEGAQRGSSRSSATPKIDSTSSLHAAPSKIAISAPPPPFSLPFHPSQIPHVPPHSRLAPAQEPTLTHNLFSPSTRTLTFKSYAPYITQEPLELPWSSYYLEMLLRFLDDCFSTPGTRRHLESQQTSHLPIAQMLKSYQPNKQAIRAAVGELGTSKAYEGLTGHERYRIQALRNTMRWIWEDSGVRLEQAAWLVLEANKVKRLLPVYVLIRDHSITQRFGDAICANVKDVLEALSSIPPSQLSPKQRSALTLLRWLDDDPHRWITFFSLPDRTARLSETGQGEIWDWWLQGEGDGRSSAQLDAWEREMLRREDWRV